MVGGGGVLLIVGGVGVLGGLFFFEYLYGVVLLSMERTVKIVSRLREKGKGSVSKDNYGILNIEASFWVVSDEIEWMTTTF